MRFAPISAILALSAYPIISAAIRNTTKHPDVVHAFSGIVDVALPLPPIAIPGGLRIGMSIFPLQSPLTQTVPHPSLHT